VLNRSSGRARRLAELYGATVAGAVDIPAALADVDIVVSATASPDPVLTVDHVRAALAGRRTGRPLAILDLAVPRDVAPEVGDLGGVTLIDLVAVGSSGAPEPSTVDRAAAAAIVAAETDTFLTWLRGADVAPTLAALRSRADEVVAAELSRLAHRRPDLTDEQRADVAHAVHRVVRRLLHSPTVRVRQLASAGAGDRYAAALRDLFDLSVPDPNEDVPRAVDVAPETVASQPVEEEPR
jgi:glutamyl-tRNA reductase